METNMKRKKNPLMATISIDPKQYVKFEALIKK